MTAANPSLRLRLTLPGGHRDPWSSRSARTSSRTRCSPHGSAGTARSCRCRSAQARLALEADYGRRDGLGRMVLDVSSSFNDERRALLGDRHALEADVTGIEDAVARNEVEKGVRLRPILDAVDMARVESTPSFTPPSRERWPGPPPDRTGRGRRVTHTWPGSGGSRRSRRRTRRSAASRSAPPTLRGMGFDLDAEEGIRPDLETPAAEVAPRMRDRSRPAARRPPHHPRPGRDARLRGVPARGGHALHYAGCDPALPLSVPAASRDHALTEIYSFLLDSISQEPVWHAEHFDLSDAEARENAEGARFSNTLLFRRYSAKLGFELDFWKRFPSTAGRPKDTRSGSRRPPEFVSGRESPADMDAGFYSADYLRAWARSAQLRAYLRREVGEDWWRREGTGDSSRALP